jgi:hypothetical protein
MWTFEPTANLDDFDGVPGLRRAWHDFLDRFIDQNIYGYAGWNPDVPPGPPNVTPFAVEELRRRGATASDLRFYNPTYLAVPPGTSSADVTWNALPTSFDDVFNGDRGKVLAFLDARQRFSADVADTRIQDEYCEWNVEKTGGKITAVTFTAEPPEYYDFLCNPPAGVNRDDSRRLLVQLYQGITGNPDIQLADLLDAHGNYDRWNRHNNAGCVHMQQPSNTLGAQVNLAVRSAILRRDAQGHLIKDADQLIRIGRYGNPKRQSDPAIGAKVNSVARDNRFVTLENPVGLYIAGLDTSGWSTPDGTDPRAFWRVVRGKPSDGGTGSTIVRAIYAVPASKGYTVSDIKIGSEPILFGGQIAEDMKMRLGALAGPIASIAAPRAVPGFA